MKPRSVSLLLVAVALSACTPNEKPAQVTSSPTSSSDPAVTIAVMAPAFDPKAESVLRGASFAAKVLARDESVSRPIRIKRFDGGSAVDLAGLTDDGSVMGAITIGGAEMISASQDVLRTSSFAVIETRDDLYERSLLGPSVFQMHPPRTWQAFRLARYFGPGDRGYSKIGLIREPGPEGDATAKAMTDAAGLRGLSVIDSPGDPQAAIASLRAAKPEVVMVEGSSAFISTALKALSSDPSMVYAGKRKIRDGWRPQIAGFESLLGNEPPAGTVASGDYARPSQSDGRIERIESFRKDFLAAYKQQPSWDEIYGYEAVQTLVEAAKRFDSKWHFDESSRSRLVEELEKFDRVRFSHLPISLGPDDHVLAERDVLGLYCFDQGRWLHLMRAFTSDLERTNILEEDWAFYFEGAVPGGEAPFFHQSKGGIVTDRSDDLR